VKKYRKKGEKKGVLVLDLAQKEKGVKTLSILLVRGPQQKGHSSLKEKKGPMRKG